jgi:hypothetical protein
MKTKPYNNHGINNITNPKGQTKGETKAREFRENPGFCQGMPPNPRSEVFSLTR